MYLLAAKSAYRNYTNFVDFVPFQRNIDLKIDISQENNKIPFG